MVGTTTSQCWPEGERLRGGGGEGGRHVGREGGVRRKEGEGTADGGARDGIGGGMVGTTTSQCRPGGEREGGRRGKDQEGMGMAGRVVGGGGGDGGGGGGAAAWSERPGGEGGKPGKGGGGRRGLLTGVS